MTPNTNAALVEALESANRAINSMKVEAETAAQGDEQMMLEACEQISKEGLEATIAIRVALRAAAAQPTISSGVAHTIQRALVKFSGSELERLRALQVPDKAANATFGAARVAAQQNIDDADDAMNWLAASHEAPQPAVQQGNHIGALRHLIAACNRLDAESEEFDLPDGWGCGAQMEYWNEFRTALERAKEAIATQPSAHTGLKLTDHNMTLRDYFAAKAMQAYVSSYPKGNVDCENFLVAGDAYDMADAMLEARAANEGANHG